jgi:hypothetical protein
MRTGDDLIAYGSIQPLYPASGSSGEGGGDLVKSSNEE